MSLQTPVDRAAADMHIHLDLIGGIAGDMFLAACLDAWPHWEQDLHAAMHTGGLPSDWRLDVVPGRSNGLAGTRVNIVGPQGARAERETHDHRSGLPHRHGADQATVSHRDIRRRLQSSDLPEDVAGRALDMFERLATVEARAHGVDVDDVHFHELADWDSVADIVGAAWCIESSGAQSWSMSPLPLGSGTVNTAHGPLPVPAPAVTHLLEGYPVIDDGVGGERVTPTGAAIVAHLGPSTRRTGGGILATSGHGLGSRDLPDRANLLRLLVLAPLDSATDQQSRPWRDGTVTVISFEIDDQSPEDLAVALDLIRGADGVLDVGQSPVAGKKGRLAVSVQVLCLPEARDGVIRACFGQTTTIGLRWRDEQRAELDRASVDRHGILGKEVVRPNGSFTSKPEIDSISAVADDQTTRAAARRRFNENEDPQ